MADAIAKQDQNATAQTGREVPHQGEIEALAYQMAM